MKKVVRLTESDLIKIVKKVLKEQENDETIIRKAKVYNDTNRFITNIDIYSAKVLGHNVVFEFSEAGKQVRSSGDFSCQYGYGSLYDKPIKFSNETTEWFMSYCNQYSQNNSSTKQTNTSSYV